MCSCLSTHTVCAPPQLFLWGSGSDSCPSGLNRAHTVLKKTCSAHCSEVSLPLPLSLSLSGVLSGRPNKRQWKHPTLAQTATMSMVITHSHTHIGKKILPLSQRQRNKHLRDVINNNSINFRSIVHFWIKPIILCKKIKETHIHQGNHSSMCLLSLSSSQKIPNSSIISCQRQKYITKMIKRYEIYN